MSIKDPRIKERNAQRIYGCKDSEAIALNDGLALRDKHGWAIRYCLQRQAAKKRGISWEISFPEWMAVWDESGFMSQRGVGRGGFCMARHGDEGPYKVDNVSIIPSVQNSSDGMKKSHRLNRFSGHGNSQRQAGKGRGWTLREKGRRRYQVVLGNKYIGVFETEHEARSAYLAAVDAHVGRPSV